MIETDTSGLRSRIARTKVLLQMAETQAYNLALYFLNVIKVRTPKKSGATAASWEIKYHKVQDAIVWEIVPEGKEKEVTWLEFGTPPHVILPHGQALRFEAGGETVYAARVFHPGTKPLGFVRLTQEDLDKSAREIADRLLNGIRSVWG